MPSAKNIETLKKNRELLKDGKAFYFTDFTGINVQRLETLRRELKKNQCKYLVVKNTLGFLLFKDMGFNEGVMKEVFTGNTGVAIAYDDPIVLVKILKSDENVKIKGGIVEGQFYDAKDVLKFAEIPSKTALYSELVGSLNIIGNFVGVLEGILRNLVWTLKSLQDRPGAQEQR